MSYRRISRLFVILVVFALLVGALPVRAQDAPAGAAPPYATDIAERAARLKPIDMSQAAQGHQLEEWETQVLDKLIQAAAYMDAAFWQQVDPEGEMLFHSLVPGDALDEAARLMLDANYGRWDRFDNFAPFVGDLSRPPGGYVFPPDLTKAELDGYIAAHPDQQDALLSPYTVVQRDGDALVAIPYHEAYAEYVLPTANLLEEAADLSQNESLANYLRLQAEALRTDDYFDADMAWLDVAANVDVSIGPHEVYDDQLTGQKAFYKANVLVVDQEGGAQLDKFKAAVPELQANLPVPAAFRPDQTGTLTPMELADDVHRSGQSRSVMEGVAFSLPNDPNVWAAKGAKKVIMSNFVNTRRENVLLPLLQAIFDEEANSWSSEDGYFNWLLMHEVSHSLGPRTVLKDGEEIKVSQALGDVYSPIEEGKADITGLYNIVYLRDHGVIDTPLEDHYAGWLSEALRSVRFGPASAYGLIRSAAWNFFVEKGALSLSPDGDVFHVDVDKMTQAVEELAIQLLTLEGEGDAAGAKAFLDQYSYVAPELQALLDKANAVVPIEFVPMYTTQTGEAATAEATATTTTATGPVPLKDAAATMDPPAVWENFYNLTQVPRPSHHEEKATAFLSDFGNQLGLETIVNDVGDVIIRKPATPGMEDRPGVILQAHMDMVAQKTADKEQDFETDPIDAYVEEGWVKADRTTLGADDGIGVAIIMAILQDEEISHPALEALFTTSEEDGFIGINGLEPGVLQGTTFINVDSEEEGVYTISSAGGAFVDVSATYAEEETPEDTTAFDVRVGDLQGGHSGVDIDKGRGSASQLLARLIWNAPAELGLRVAKLDGGSVSNAIPHNATALVVVSTEQTEAFEQYVADFAATVKNELAATEPDMVVEATPADLPAAVMDADAQHALLGAVYGVPQGVLRMSDNVPGLVETSDSMGVLSIGDGQFVVDIYVRSAIDSARDNASQRLTAVFDLTGSDVSTNGAYSGWPPNPDSPILALMQQTYEDLFGVAPTVSAVHAGLETSVAGVTYPGLDMISVGPTLHDVHSPDERLEVASVPKVYDLLVATLAAIPAQ